MKRIRVHIAEDHDVVKDGILSLLKNVNIDTVGCTKNGVDCIEWFQTNVADVLILDIDMPELDGVGVLKKLKERNIDVKTLILSCHSEEIFIKESFKHGALGYILKDDLSYDLSEVIRIINNGETFYSEGVNQNLLLEAQDELALLDGLTPTEVEVLANLGYEGCYVKNKTIKTSTLRVHLLNIRRKLNLKTNAGLAKFALLIQNNR